MLQRIGIFLCVAGLTACGDPSVRSETDRINSILNSAPLPAQSCSGCHGPGNVAIVDLSDWSSRQIRDSLQRYKAETDGVTVMHRIARGYSDDEIESIGSYLMGRNMRRPNDPE